MKTKIAKELIYKLDLMNLTFFEALEYRRPLLDELVNLLLNKYDIDLGYADSLLDECIRLTELSY